MRAHFLTAALAITAAALPQKRDDTPTSLTSKRDGGTDLKYVCELPGPTKDDWDKLDMGYFANSTSMMWCDGVCLNGMWEMSYPKTIANFIGLTRDFSCIAGEDCDIPIDTDKCDDNTSWAKYSFILKSLKNLHDHLNKVLSTLNSGQLSYASQQVYWVEQYSTTPKDDSATGAAGTILAGIFGIAASFIGGPITKLGGTASAGIAGGLGMASGSGALIAGAEAVMALNLASNLQKKIESIADMSKAFTDGFEEAMDTVKTIHQQALEDIPQNYDIQKGYSYKDVPTGAVAMINSGAFAESMTTADTLASDKDMRKVLSAAAVSYVWRDNEQTFIAKLSDELYGYAPCDLPLSNLWRLCDNGVAYLFLRYQARDYFDDITDWNPPAGVDDFDDKEDLTLAEFAQAAEANQNAHGYDLTFDPESAAKLFLSDNPVKDGLLVNIPVCYLDSAIKATGDADADGPDGAAKSMARTIRKSVASRDSWSKPVSQSRTFTRAGRTRT